MEHLTPKQIVAELDKYIIGQSLAKKAVAIALRNRWRRLQLPQEKRDDITPKNILLIGPTGVGKTEIARRLAKITESPFIKVEASKFTEVGFVGRDVESIIRDLVEIAISEEKVRMREQVLDEARKKAEDILLDRLLPVPTGYVDQNSIAESKEKFRKMLHQGKLDDRNVEIDIEESHPQIEILTNAGIDEISSNLQDIFKNIFPGQKKRRLMKVKDAFIQLEQQEANRMLDMEKVKRNALYKVEHSGIVFIDEIDKICSREGYTKGGDVSREGVQRDLLPIIEGSTIMTKYGMVKTDHILFIGAGAFHIAKPSDLIPELQGRFPIRVELDSLTKEDFIKILKEPENALTKQYRDLLMADEVEIEFTNDGIEKIAEIATELNKTNENIGARRLHTIIEKVLEDISYEAPFGHFAKIVIDSIFVESKLKTILAKQDLSKYIL
ncbi:ATP-dependent protease ATPase subunit HslU [Calditerrivibrio nitroreducens]|uniref:ATP-dependent protease ATPase subunit HslU n=1 Tax=Calditerrivibrio nitroreducens (strain DSM 19672 / NBRC 101217 / Yu37-1) TaxID=768670 RepID=E4TER8_CALNY|nr:ATP-dependent protease ATPase subunit HslU [Calditerrivibrio nitroreducens]ADR19425.1 heat shock protein HslVU, ATPase subunit HslU [Calditerrivibrio nitroreducens DSM 19672]